MHNITQTTLNSSGKNISEVCEFPPPDEGSESKARGSSRAPAPPLPRSPPSLRLCESEGNTVSTAVILDFRHVIIAIKVLNYLRKVFRKV